MNSSSQHTRKKDFYTDYNMSFSICNFKTFHSEFDHLKICLRKNNYSLNFNDPCINPFLNNLYAP